MQLALKNISKQYQRRFVLRDINLAVHPHEFLCFLGPSGSGKSTLLHIIAGHEAPSTGRVFFGSRDITGLRPETRRFGMVFQHYALFPNLTVWENIAYGLHGLPRNEQKRRVADMLELVGLQGKEHRLPLALSGGEQQRVALARALAPKPELLLLDEPLSALDAKVRKLLCLELRRLQKHLKITTIMVTHDQQEAMGIADRIMVLQDGAIEQVDTPERLYTCPQTRFVASFIGEMNFINLPDLHNGKPCGIRPEHVEVREPTEFSLQTPHTVIAKVEDVQRTGPSLRVHLLLDGTTRIAAELPVQPLVLCTVGSYVAVTFPEQSCCTWKELP